MKDLMAGNRHGTFAQAVTLAAVACFAIVGGALIAAFHSDAKAALGQARFAHRELVTITTLIRGRCEQREAYDLAAQEGWQGQVRLYQQLIAIDRGNPVNVPHARRLQSERIAAYRAAIAALQVPLRDGAPRGCNQFVVPATLHLTNTAMDTP